MIVATKDLKEFLKLSKPIKQNKILPILDYIKLDVVGGTAIFTKTNQHSYCVYSIQCESKEEVSILIDESKLSALISNSDSDIITIKEKKTSIELQDDKSKMSFHKEDASLYPVMPESNSKRWEIPEEVISAIRIAKGYIIETELPTQWSYVFLVPGGDSALLYGAEMSGFYMKKFNYPLPPFNLTKEAATLVSLFPSASYQSNGNYDFFTSDNTTYGFIKNESNPLPVDKLYSRATTGNYFEVSKSELISFCDMAVGISGDLIATLNISDSDGGISLKYKAHETNTSLNTDILAVKDAPITELDMGIKTLSRCLRPLPYEQLRITQQCEAHYRGFILTHPEDPGYFGVIMGFGNKPQ